MLRARVAVLVLPPCLAAVSKTRVLTASLALLPNNRNCSAGYDAEDETCAACNTGEWSAGGGFDDGKCQTCPQMFADGGSFGGQYLSFDVESTCSTARDCFPKYDGGTSNCAPCSDGWFSTGGGPDIGFCSACPDLTTPGSSGSYLGPDTEEFCPNVRKCDAGFDGDDNQCLQCVPGSWSPGGGPGVGTCVQCPGLYNGGEGGTYIEWVLVSEAKCPDARDCNPGYGGDLCTPCDPEKYSSPDSGEQAICEDCPVLPTGWEYHGKNKLKSTTECETDSVCSAGYGESDCSVCATGKFSYGGVSPWEQDDIDRTPACTSCEDMDLGKPPNSYYDWDNSDYTKHVDKDPACEYSCNGPYSPAWNSISDRGACDEHPLCPSKSFYNPRFNPNGGNGSCWKLQDIAASFEDARRHCIQQGGDVVEIRVSDDDVAASYARDTFAWENEYVPTPFLGLTDRVSEGTFYLLDNTAVSYTNWAAGEPSDSVEVNGEDCAVLVEGGEWNDIPCNSLQATICALPISPVARETCDEIASDACYVRNLLPAPCHACFFLRARARLCADVACADRGERTARLSTGRRRARAPSGTWATAWARAGARRKATPCAS